VLPNLQHTVRWPPPAQERQRNAPAPAHGGQRTGPRPGAIYASTDPEEASAILRDSLEQVPYAVGVNNHMGSVVTRDRRIMDSLFAVIREKGLSSSWTA
jgi:polysaccharide deacetylase 2 family uncharacterized protein YibQ